MPESIVILGGGGHAAVVEAALLSLGKSVEAFLDDGLPVGSKVIEGEVKGKIADLASLKGKADKVHAAIGSNEARFTLLHKAKELGFTPETIVHPTAFVDSSAKLGEGVFVAA
ncbi:hexapeptide transferase, partial [bacterium]|nr:hexapeptide transferase [bacterium]